MSELQARPDFVKLKQNDGMIKGEFRDYIKDTQGEDREFTLDIGVDSEAELEQAIKGNHDVTIHLSLRDNVGNITLVHTPKQDSKYVGACLQEMFKQLKASQN